MTGRRRIAVLLGAGGLLLTAVLFAGWASTRPDAAGHALPLPDVVQRNDIDLLAYVERPGFKRSNCVHEATDADSVAITSCAANYDAANPAARFWRFHTADKMREYYEALLGLTKASACPGDPPGLDAPSMRNGVEIGRRTCYFNEKMGPGPRPAFAITNVEIPAMAIFYWNDISEQPLRDWEARQDYWQYRRADEARDPDDFTAADRELFGNLGKDWRPANCLRGRLPVGFGANAAIYCATANGSPKPVFLGFGDRNAATKLYQKNLADFTGHPCGGGADRADGIWRQQGHQVGRYFCYQDPVTARPCLISLPDEYRTMGIFCTLQAADPHLGPKSERELDDWFQRSLG
ncbi:hypothetical protein LTV02_37770 [Nocardia yamanashiensis]|uniref:hypothetical protein n=1 Tax=Nocardia yamanashiensis TaxID=209247 RepID=UPI001E48782D|nr:hypothetical protein [Nocardia yamanashiensis]UGT41604.1 hypothetical protein LTV02_37770 [Nocardia yamanashiensis]